MEYLAIHKCHSLNAGCTVDLNIGLQEETQVSVWIAAELNLFSVASDYHFM